MELRGFPDDWRCRLRNSVSGCVRSLPPPFCLGLPDSAPCRLSPPKTAHPPYLHCPGQNLYEYRTQFSVYAVAASPLIVSTDIRNMTSIMKQILLNKKVIAVNQQTTPPGARSPRTPLVPRTLATSHIVCCRFGGTCRRCCRRDRGCGSERR